MRILFLTGEYPAMQGGVGDYTRQLSLALGALGADAHVLTSVEAGEDHLRGPAGADEPAVYPALASAGWSLWDTALRLITQLHPAVVHVQYQAAAYGMHPAVNYLPWRLRLLTDRPRVVTTFHDLKVPYLFPKAGALRRHTVLALARGSDAVILTNPADWDQLAGGPLATRLRPIPIGSNIHCRPPLGYDRAAQRARWGAGPEDWLLAYFGFLNANKGGETLMRCLASLVAAGKPARLLMVGGQTGASDPTNVSYLAHVERLIGELGLKERVAWTGFTAPEDVSANLLAADCAVLPYREGASLRHGSLMAALTHGLPIVTTRTRQPAAANGRFPALQDGASALLVPPDDAGAAAAGVIQVMADAALRARLGSGALSLARYFGWQEIARQHMEVYSEL